MRRWRSAALAVGLLWGCGGGGGEKPAAPPAPAEPAPPASAFVALETEILAPRCAAQPGCHDGASPAGHLDLSAGNAHRNLVGVKATRRPERLRVVAGDPAGSYLVERVAPGGDTPVMPVGSEPLTAAEVERIKAWIADGAKP